MATPASTSLETKIYTLAEIAKHNDNKETWIIIDNSVYDVTAFLNEVIYILFLQLIIYNITNKIKLSLFISINNLN